MVKQESSVSFAHIRDKDLGSVLGLSASLSFALGSVPGSHPRVWCLPALPDKARWTELDWKGRLPCQRWGWVPRLFGWVQALQNW